MDAALTTRHRQFYTDAENAVLRLALERLIDSYGTQTRAAEMLGVKQATISGFLGKKHGATPNTARKIAQLSGTTVDRLLGWSSGGPDVRDLYANRTVAVQMARLAGLDEAEIARGMKIRLEEGVIDRPVLWWFDQIRYP